MSQKYFKPKNKVKKNGLHFFNNYQQIVNKLLIFFIIRMDLNKLYCFM